MSTSTAGTSSYTRGPLGTSKKACGFHTVLCGTHLWAWLPLANDPEKKHTAGWMSRSASQRTFILQTLLCLGSPNTQDHHTQEKGRIYAIQQEGQGVCVCVCVCRRGRRFFWGAQKGALIRKRRIELKLHSNREHTFSLGVNTYLQWLWGKC